MDDGELRRELQKHHLDSFGWARCCCAKKGGDPDEVLQAAYLRVLEGQARFGERSGFKTWLFGVIRHTAAEERRKNLMRRLRLAVFRPAEHAAGPEQEAQRSEEQAIFERALRELPRRQGELMHLVFYQEMSLSEAAGVMGISVGAARRHYERGKEALRQCLKVRAHDESGPGRSVVSRAFW